MSLNSRLSGILFSALALLLLLSTQASAESAISVEGAYARAVPPTARNSGAFMRIHNSSNEARRIVSAKADVSAITELHDHINDQGVMRMRKVEYIEVPAQGSVELKPGSYHVMLIELKQALKPGDPVHIDLTVDDGSVVPVDLQAKSVVMGMRGGHGGKCGSGKCGAGKCGMGK